MDVVMTDYNFVLIPDHPAQTAKDVTMLKRRIGIAAKKLGFEYKLCTTQHNTVSEVFKDVDFQSDKLLYVFHGLADYSVKEIVELLNKENSKFTDKSWECGSIYPAGNCTIYAIKIQRFNKLFEEYERKCKYSIFEEKETLYSLLLNLDDYGGNTYIKRDNKIENLVTNPASSKRFTGYEIGDSVGYYKIKKELGGNFRKPDSIDSSQKRLCEYYESCPHRHYKRVKSKRRSKTDEILKEFQAYIKPKEFVGFISAGGKGSRFMKGKLPKALSTVKGAPLIHRLISDMHSTGIEDIVVHLNNKARCRSTAYYIATAFTADVNDLEKSMEDPKICYDPEFESAIKIFNDPHRRVYIKPTYWSRSFSIIALNRGIGLLDYKRFSHEKASKVRGGRYDIYGIGNWGLEKIGKVFLRPSYIIATSGDTVFEKGTFEEVKEVTRQKLRSSNDGALIYMMKGHKHHNRKVLTKNNIFSGFSRQKLELTRHPALFVFNSKALMDLDYTPYSPWAEELGRGAKYLCQLMFEQGKKIHVYDSENFHHNVNTTNDFNRLVRTDKQFAKSIAETKKFVKASKTAYSKVRQNIQTSIARLWHEEECLYDREELPQGLY